MFSDSSDISGKSCWAEYGSKLENSYSKLESTYSKLESPYSKLENPYSKLENPYSKLESHYSKLDSPYSKLESHYTSSLAQQHFNNIKMDPQQGRENTLVRLNISQSHEKIHSPRVKSLYLL